MTQQELESKFEILTKQVMPKLIARIVSTEETVAAQAAEIETLKKSLGEFSDWAGKFSSQHVEHVTAMENDIRQLHNDMESLSERHGTLVERMTLMEQNDKPAKTTRTRRKKTQESEVSPAEEQPIEAVAEPVDAGVLEEPIDVPVTDMPNAPEVIDGVAITSAVLSNIETYTMMGMDKTMASDIADMASLPVSVVNRVLSLTPEECNIIRMKF